MKKNNIKNKSKIKIIIIIILIIYLLVSSIYILNYINFFGIDPGTIGLGFSETNNKLRLFMGLPKTYSTYEGVSSIYLIEVIFKIILAIILIGYLRKGRKNCLKYKHLMVLMII